MPQQDRICAGIAHRRQIGVADAAGAHFDQDLARLRVLQLHLVQNGCCVLRGKDDAGQVAHVSGVL